MSITSVHKETVKNILKGVSTIADQTVKQVTTTQQVLYGPAPMTPPIKVDKDEILFDFDQNLEETDTSGTIKKEIMYPRLEGVTNIDIDKCNETIDKYKDRDVAELSNDEFVEYIAAGAQLAYLNDGILPSVTIAQAIEESGWGEKSIGKNLFGIKKSSDWKGKTIEKETQEQDPDGTYYTITAEFKDYDSIVDGINDHNKLLNESWFKPVREACDNNDPHEACRQLQECGYATELDYDDELISIIDYNNLTQYDPKYEQNIFIKRCFLYIIIIGEYYENIKKNKETI